MPPLVLEVARLVEAQEGLEHVLAPVERDARPVVVDRDREHPCVMHRVDLDALGIADRVRARGW